MGWIGRYIGALWRIARGSHVEVHPDLRQGSGASALYLFLLLLFGSIAVVLVLLGINLNDVDRWLDAQGSWIEAVGSILFRLLCAIILFFCAFGVLGGLWQRTRPKGEEDRIGWGMMLFALVLGYFAWFGVLG